MHTQFQERKAIWRNLPVHCSYWTVRDGLSRRFHGNLNPMHRYRELTTSGPSMTRLRRDRYFQVFLPYVHTEYMIQEFGALFLAEATQHSTVFRVNWSSRRKSAHPCLCLCRLQSRSLVSGGHSLTNTNKPSKQHASCSQCGCASEHPEMPSRSVPYVIQHVDGMNTVKGKSSSQTVTAPCACSITCGQVHFLWFCGPLC